MFQGFRHTTSVPSASPSMTSPRSPASLPASSVHTPGNKVAQLQVACICCCSSSQASSPFSPNNTTLLFWLVWPVDLSMFHSKSYHPGHCHAADTSLVHPTDWANGQVSRVPMTGREYARITADKKGGLATSLTDSQWSMSLRWWCEVTHVDGDKS